jgi:glyoxylase-like metal-dependent hydrolase (beta-lactamase superfamily II)
MARLSFHGGAGTVTGSRHLLETGGGSVLVDCGLFQGHKQLRERNWQDPGFDPRRVTAVILTHAHIDHSGWLPRLVGLGFSGPILATPATADLADVMSWVRHGRKPSPSRTMELSMYPGLRASPVHIASGRRPPTTADCEQAFLSIFW